MADFTFQKVSLDQYLKDWKKLYLNNSDEESFNQIKDRVAQIWEDIKLPERSTEDSAGYDFYSPFRFILNAGTNIIIPTGIKFKAERNDIVLLCMPRSSMGFKHGIRLTNTIGVIDADYQYAENEGHIMMNLHMDGKMMPLRMQFSGDDLYTRDDVHIFSNTRVTIEKGDKYIQGIVVNYFTDGTIVINERTGGLGSTGN